MTEQFDTKRSRLIMGKSSLSSHNHVLRTWKQNMLYRATKVDFWQAIPPLWQPHQQHAATARLYITKSMQDHGLPGLMYITLLLTWFYDFFTPIHGWWKKNSVKIEGKSCYNPFFQRFVNLFWPNFSLKNSYSHLKTVFRASRKKLNIIRKRLQIGFHPILNCCPPPHLYGKIRLKVNSAVYLPITTIPITISVTHVFFFFVLRFYPYIGCKKTVPDKIFLMSDDVLICMHHFFFAPKIV